MATSREDRSSKRDANILVRKMGTGGSRKPSAKAPGDGSIAKPLGKHEGNRDERSAAYEGDAMPIGGAIEEHEYE